MAELYKENKVKQTRHNSRFHRLLNCLYLNLVPKIMSWKVSDPTGRIIKNMYEHIWKSCPFQLKKQNNHSLFKGQISSSTKCMMYLGIIIFKAACNSKQSLKYLSNTASGWVCGVKWFFHLLAVILWTSLFTFLSSVFHSEMQLL